MGLTRCPSCRTLRDATEGRRCVGCGGEFPASPPESGNSSAVTREGKRDRNLTSALLVGLGILGSIDSFYSGRFFGLALGLIAILAGVYRVIGRMLDGDPAEPGSARSQEGIAGCLWGLALLGGLVILVAYTCVTHLRFD